MVGMIWRVLLIAVAAGSTVALEIPSATIRRELSTFATRCAPHKVRTISQWVEEELILPDGPYSGERFRHHRHPVSRLWFDAIDSGKWNRFAVTAPTQNGKTLMGYVAPILYHLFELRETVVIGLPTMQMAQDKWMQDILPAIETSRYRDFIPSTGEGSRGGMVKRAVIFRNGAVLRFMTAGGGDKQRAGFTTRVVAITETDGMDNAGEASREADAVEQIEARTLAYGRRDKRVYLECTVSVEHGRIWQEVTRGTDTRIYRPCPHCGQYVSPDREDLHGWQETESAEEAAERAHWACPSCRAAWDDADRRGGWRNAVLVHRGQTVTPGGEIVGESPRTQTFGLRWSAVDNPFTCAADLGAEEWKAARDHDRENAEKKLRQFYWALPWVPDDVILTPLTVEEILQRASLCKRGIVPPDALGVSVGIDTGKRHLHWVATAVQPGGGGHVIDYGEHPVNADELGVERGLLASLGELQSFFAAGWQDVDGRKVVPSQVWIDSGYHEHQPACYGFCQAISQGMAFGQAIYRPAKGFGEGQNQQRYFAPTSRGDKIRYVGNQYHFSKVDTHRLLLVHVNADAWKSQLHQRLHMPVDAEGAVTLYDTPSAADHREFAEQIRAEHQVETWRPARGTVIVWEREQRANHYLDAGYLSLAAGSYVAAYTTQKQRPKDPKARPTLQELAAGGRTK